MSQDMEGTNRRKVLKGIGGAAIAAGIGAGGFIATTGSAAAASGNLSISGSSVSNDDGDLSQVHVTLDHEASWDGFDYPVEAVEYRDVLRVYDGEGNQLGSDVLRDGTDSPVLLENWSSDGSSDGWGGPDEHTSGPGTQGTVNAGIVWTVLAEDGATPDNPIPQGSSANIEDYGLDNGADDSTAKYTVEMVKTVRFYTTDPDGSYTANDGETSLRLMGGDDGTIGEVKADGQFQLNVTNEAATTSSSGTGSSEAE